MGKTTDKVIMISVACLWVACNAKTESTPGRDKLLKQTPYSKDPNDNDLSQGNGKGEESVVPPGNVSGAYLICEDVASAVASNATTSVRCALRNEATNQKLDLVSDFALYQWNAINKPENFVEVKFVELADDPDWHVTYTLSGRDNADIQKFKRAKNLSLKVEAKGGSKHTFAAVSPEYNLRWESVNGAPIPANAVQGGTEGKGLDTLFLCRSFVKNQVMPGKLISIVAGDSKSTCMTADAGQGQTSVDFGNGRLVHFYEALVLDNARFDDILEWVPASNGQHPALAVLTGLDLAGAPSYTCRGSVVHEFTRPEGEFAPGQLRAGADSCVIEAFGEQKTVQYEVLAYKSAAVKAMFERVDE